ncbi:MAG: GtrA family protein [Anaerolinea sp.]|nr:GtrA family protein [Anaerolinea sp.]
MSQITSVPVKIRRVALRNPLDVPIQAVAGRFGEKAREVERFLKFAIVGMIGAVIDFGTLFILQATVLAPVDPNKDLRVAVASSIAFVAAVTSNFFWNRYWTYPDSRSKPILRQFGMFFVLSVVGLLIRTPIFAFFSGPMVALVETMQYGVFAGLIDFAVNTLHISVEQLGLNLALVIAVLVVLFWNFFSNRFITYSDVKFGK